MAAARFLWLHALRGGDPAVLRLLHWGSTLRWGLGSHCADAGDLFDRQLGAVQFGLLAWGMRMVGMAGDVFLLSGHFFGQLGRIFRVSLSQTFKF